VFVGVPVFVGVVVYFVSVSLGGAGLSPNGFVRSFQSCGVSILVVRLGSVAFNLKKKRTEFRVKMILIRSTGFVR
jgi:hypothetical protein